MPAFFEDEESGPDEILGGKEGNQIFAIRDFILSLAETEKKPSAFEVAKKRYPGATRARGAQLMSELNCAGCHDVGGMHEREEAGPPLAHEGSRVTRGWLTRFLKNPFRIRPIGYVAGGSSRMPDFRLSAEEAEAIAAFLMTRADKRIHAQARPYPGKEAKAKRGGQLFTSLRCGACHRTEAAAKGNMGAPARFAGPDLSHAGSRLQEGHLVPWLGGEVTRSGSKLEMDAHPLVPKFGLTRKQLEDLAAFVTSNK